MGFLSAVKQYFHEVWDEAQKEEAKRKHNKTFDTTKNEEKPILKEDKELEQMMHQEFIERNAQCIRMVVVCYVDCFVAVPHYDIRRLISYIKENHKRVMFFKHRKDYQEIVQFAEHDIFYGRFKLLGDDVESYKEFFQQYVADPTILDLNKIKDTLSEREIEFLGEDFFKL